MYISSSAAGNGKMYTNRGIDGLSGGVSILFSRELARRSCAATRTASKLAAKRKLGQALGGEFGGRSASAGMSGCFLKLIQNPSARKQNEATRPIAPQSARVLGVRRLTNATVRPHPASPVATTCCQLGPKT